MSDAESINGAGEPEETERVTPAEHDAPPWEERPASSVATQRRSSATVWQRYLMVAIIGLVSVVLVAYGVWELSHQVARREEQSNGNQQAVPGVPESNQFPLPDVPEAPAPVPIGGRP